MSGSGTEPVSLGIVRYTLDPAYTEFGYIKHAATTNRSLSKSVTAMLKKVQFQPAPAYKEPFIFRLLTRCKRDPV